MSEQTKEAREMVILDIENAEIDQQAIDFVRGTQLFQSLVKSVGSEKAERIIRDGSRVILEDVPLPKNNNDRH